MHYLQRLTPSGRFLYAGAVMGFGAQCLFRAKPIFGLEPLPAWLPWTGFWAVVTAAILLVGGTGLVTRPYVRPAAWLLTGLLAVWIVFLHLPKLLAAPTNGGAWTCAFETLAIGSAAWMLACRPATPTNLPERWGVRLARVGYGVSLPAFGVLHLVYWQYVSSVIPAWLPWPLFWTYFTAAAFFAAGAAITSGIFARTAAMWTGVMFLSWVLMLHLPRALAKPGNFAEWTSLLVALAMGGGAWIIARSVADSREPARVAD